MTETFSPSEYKKRIYDCGKPWLLFGIESARVPQHMQGISGVIDWTLHGQVSALLKKNAIAAEELCLIPSRSPGLFPHCLCFLYSESSDPKKLAKQVGALNADQILLVNSSFPADFSTKLEQNLSKEKISFTRWEP